MNKSLEKYINDENVKHISGYNYPGFGGNQNSSYFTPYMSCWVGVRGKIDGQKIKTLLKTISAIRINLLDLNLLFLDTKKTLKVN